MEIYFQNCTYSSLNVAIITYDGKKGLLVVPAGKFGVFRQVPNLDCAISAFSSNDGSLQHIGKVRPSLALYEIRPNVGVSPADFTDEVRALADEFSADVE